MNEHAVRFGEWRSLVGVVSEPEGSTPVPDAPAVLFLNSGLLHHAGPHRLYVNLARRLARRGFLSLRFDLSGIGDSGPRQDRMSRQESLVRETQDAMDHLAATHGVQRFVLYGICTGADQAVRVALADPRVCGAVLVDGYAYRTRAFHMHHYSSRLLRTSSWKSVLTGQHPAYAWIRSWFAGRRDQEPPQAPALRAGLYVRPPQLEADAMLHQLSDHGCRLCFVFTPSARFNHRAQFEAMFPSLAHAKGLGVEFLEHSDHVFTLRSSQEAMMQVIESWITSVDWSSVSSTPRPTGTLAGAAPASAPAEHPQR